jgi:hypothetical protein
MIRAACRSVIFAFGQATRRTQEHPGSANNKPQVVEAAEAAEAARGRDTGDAGRTDLRRNPDRRQASPAADSA